jgi:hypothetical protein
VKAKPINTQGITFNGTVDYQSNPAIPSKAFITLRLKPLGAGKGDVVFETEK